MKLQYSEVAKIPRIVVDDDHVISFVNEETLMEKGNFKYFHVSGLFYHVTQKRKAKNAEEKSREVVAIKQSDICNLLFEDLDNEFKNLKPFKKTIPVLVKLLKKYLVNKLFDPARLDDFKNDLESLKIENEEKEEKNIKKRGRKCKKKK